MTSGSRVPVTVRQTALPGAPCPRPPKPPNPPASPVPVRRADAKTPVPGPDTPALRPAVFLDRDGTLTEPRHYPSHPDELFLRPGIGVPLRALADRGLALVVVTNQSGVARGLFDLVTLEAMHHRLRALLDRRGVRLDGIYACPHHPEAPLSRYRTVCTCRKPAPGMLHRAAHDLGLDLTRSWMVGDSPCDIGAGLRAGTRTAFVGHEPFGDMRHPTTAQALHNVLRAHTHRPQDRRSRECWPEPAVATTPRTS
ncbi:D-glycero-alpha-D-manno-heptose-1,7-bisphosphate 7-phosphatase [Streptomyces sp. NPDC088097]|uniref:D-glycero-alpha-D-manno-heptose-1,7-bisphosphate 7-phosphatase n=1 Tax=Streptomyces sp. NPDC088097 TaxID=3365823 RepID=UPI00381DD001